MRNHLKQWLSLLQWSTFFTLVAAGWLTMKHHSPLGTLYRLDEKLASWLHLSAPMVNYVMLGISILLFISALCSFRCGNYYKAKYVLPVFISGAILVATLILYSIESSMVYMTIATFILPVATPFLLLRYQVWKNQVDHWSVLVCFLIATTIGSYAYQSLSNPAGIPTPSGVPIRMSELSPDLNALIVTSVAYVAIGTALALFITSLRRLALYSSILLALTISGATMISYYSASQPLYNASIAIPMTLIIISYWFFPVLVLLSLASQRKTRTLKL